MAKRPTEFQTIRSEGGLLPPDLLRRVVDPAGKVSGVEPTAYGLPAGERLNEAITQSWNRLRRHWAEFRAAVTAPQPSTLNPQPVPQTTGLTNDKWSLPLLRELGFGFLATTAGPTIDGKTYAISRFAGSTPIHLVGCGVSLDRRAAGVRGAAQSNPHGLVQEFLNRSTAHLWAIVSNGLCFRILRDNQALSRQSFLEFDLEAMFDGEVYSDFVLLWLIAHATRFLPRNDGRPDSCWLETWSKEAAEQGVAALTDLRGGVEKALEILGQGFVSHPKNTALRDALRKGDVKLSDFHGQLLRIVYRLIFLFVAEDRELEGISILHPQDKSDKGRLARERYAAHYSTSRLRELASRIKGSRHGDLWRQFQLLVGALSGEERFTAMRDALALPSLGSMLWNPASTALLNGPGLAVSQLSTLNPQPSSDGTELANVDFLEALRHLAFIRKDKILRPVDYKNLGSPEFGGVYESFLALTPQISSDGARFTFAEFAGNERKTSGSYYTPDSLVQCLLDSALDPVVQERLADAERLSKSDWAAVEKEIQSDPAKRNYVLAFLTKRAGASREATAEVLKRAWDSIPPAARRWQLSEEGILAIKVCDKACGSGHFLVGAAHRLARHLARVRALAAGESEPSPLLYQTALRDVIGHCLYGVDINPMAVELCKVTLWLEALEPGKPLSFLNHHIRCGNSLLGTTPELIRGGIPEDAYAAIEGDDKEACSALKKQNKRENPKLGEMFLADDLFGDAQAGLPLYEGRMIDYFDHRAKAYRSGRGRSAVWELIQFGDPRKSITPQWRVPERNVPQKLGDRTQHYRVVWCDVATPTAARSLVAALVPPGVICGDTTPTMRFESGFEWAYMPWLGVANSLCMDFLVRKKITLHCKYTHMDSLPFPRFSVDSELTALLGPVALRLTCTSREMTGYWNNMVQFGWCEKVPEEQSPPGLIDEKDRVAAMASIDAIVAKHVFQLTRPELQFVIDSFGVLKKQEEKELGEFRTQRLMLEAYDKPPFPSVMKRVFNTSSRQPHRLHNPCGKEAAGCWNPYWIHAKRINAY